MFLNGYPYTDFHELNADFLVTSMLELKKLMETFVALNIIKYADPLQWDITKQYEKNTVVIDSDGVAYISVQPVPEGVSLSNTDYWCVVFDLDKGDWVVIDNVLYIALTDIVIGTAYVIDTNIKRITVEEMNQVIYSPANTALSMHMITDDSAPIVETGDIHIYNPLTHTIEIRKL